MTFEYGLHINFFVLLNKSCSGNGVNTSLTATLLFIIVSKVKANSQRPPVDATV